MRVPFIIYADLESLLENISICHNDSNKPSTIKINKHTPSSYSFLHTAHLIQQKIVISIFIEVRIVWKSFVRH